jgi:hypothetical protein
MAKGPILPTMAGQGLSLIERLRLFDDATRRQQRRQRRHDRFKNATPATERQSATSLKERGWKREDLYNRGS